MFLPICKTFTMPVGIIDTVIEWEFIGLSNEKINILLLRWMNNSRIRVEFKGSCSKQDKTNFTRRNVVNLFIVYEIDTWSRDLNANLTLKDCSILITL